MEDSSVFSGFKNEHVAYLFLESSREATTNGNANPAQSRFAILVVVPFILAMIIPM